MKRNSVTDRNGSFRKVFHIAPSYGNFAQSGVTVRYGVTRDFSFQPQQESMMFKTKNQTDVAVTAALAKADDVLGLRDRIVTAIAKNTTEIKAVEAELERALEQLAVEEASLALTEDAGDNETAAQRTVQKLRLRLEAQQARLRGLDRKLAEHDDQVGDAQDALTVARDAWMRARAAEFAAEYRKAAATFAAVLRKGVAIGDALGAPDLSAAMRQARLYDPDHLSHSMIDMEPVRTDPASGMIERYPVWQDDPAAVSVHDALVDVRLKAEKLDAVANQIRHRRDEAAREEQRRQHESEPRPKTVAYEVHYPPEYSPITPVERIEAGRR
ncbi:MAG: hypothetical protein KBH81_04080 [Phycisphaerae bacterium]|nr:hypothetical protein [Phycisphaerae bacterium]